ncbi:type II toxin-antitoxin system HicB family antitoxin [Skermanella mucosa]|uniref:type II toxin-antitoxin system HicB family antitoxin n=1 Tax=Skermanella mucosa TaxID=1789672 RepID=UPI00192BF04E|nr:type II toxin-antitoxin system HicB family antitoxin [Skermanella mucosa]UEM21060.1 type II toxin-antitoxin system HicB family antitoxin [Skermanella mucosa]
MSTLNYNGYQGSVTFEDGSLVIRLLHIDDVITAQCESVQEVRKSFEALVDDYVETCRELGREPNRPFKGSFNVRMSPELHKHIAMAAAEMGESLNAWIVKAAEERLSGSHVGRSDGGNVLPRFRAG